MEVSKMIATAVRLPSDMVIVFDAGGEQILEYQGRYQDVKERVLLQALPDSVFAHGFGRNGELGVVPRSNW